MDDECDCGYCGKCREQYQHEVDTRDDSCWDKKEEPTQPETIYWRI